MARYEAGETLASIARTYDCSPPAISYVVSRSRARHNDANSPPRAASGAEPQLIKSPSSDGVGALNGTAATFPSVPDADGFGSAAANGFAANGSRPPVAEKRPESPLSSGEDRRDHDVEPPRGANGSASHGAAGRGASLPGGPAGAAPAIGQRPAAVAMPPAPAPSPAAPAPANGPDQRRRLHLSLGSAAPQASGNSDPPESQNQPGSSHRASDQASATGMSEMRPAPFDDPRPRAELGGAPRKEGGSFIDRELRARVDNDIAAFLAAFDAALVQDTQANRAALREATDRLLRVGARTRIELERLEARIPLPPRDGMGRNEPTWWHR